VQSWPPDGAVLVDPLTTPRRDHERQERDRSFCAFVKIRAGVTVAWSAVFDQPAYRIPLVCAE